MRARQERAHEIDRGLGRYAEKLSRFVWPWPESRLLVMVFVVAISDFLSTYLVLTFKNNAYESGSVAQWALDKGGFFLLLGVDLMVAGVLSLAAIGIRSFYARIKVQGYGRAAFVFILIPYACFAAFAVANNIILLFRG